MYMLKSPSIIAFSMLGSFEVSSSVISSENIVFVPVWVVDDIYQGL